MFGALRRMAGSIFGQRRGAGLAPEAGSPTGRDLRRTRTVPVRGELQAGVEADLGATRPRAELEDELRRLQKRLELLRATLAREREYARETGAHGNQAFVDSTAKQARLLEARIVKLVAALEPARPAVPAPSSKVVKLRAPLSRGRSDAAVSDDSLAQAARAAIKRGHFANASEQAIFKKIASDLAEGKAEIQLQALERLGEVKSQAALPIFRAGARHRSEEVRIAALRGVLAMRDPGTRDILLTAVADASHRVRLYAVRGLHGLEDPTLAEVLCEQLNDSHPQVRRAAATYLGWRKVAAAERWLLPRLLDESAEVRSAAATALGHCGREGAVFRLLHSLLDPEPSVREASLASLGRVLGTTPEFDLAATDELRTARVRELKAWWKTERIKRCVGDLALTPAPETAPASVADASTATAATTTPATATTDAEPAAATAKPVAADSTSNPPAPAGSAAEAPAAQSDLDSFDGDFVPAAEETAAKP